MAETMTPSQISSAVQRSSWAYRPDLDGLRAVAICLVIWEHFVTTSSLWIRGGLGVDLFFVLSGFLITSIVVKDYQEGTFRLTGFYARRVRRLFPSLIVVIVGLALGGWWWLGSQGMGWIGENIVYASTGLMNMPFSLGVPHFSVHPRQIPLAPLWSLALEEQFYLIFPWFLVLLLKLRSWRTWSMLFVGGAMVASWAYHHAFVHVVGKTYYNPLARSWELLVGVLLALWLYGRSPTQTEQWLHRCSAWGQRGVSWVMVVAGLWGFAGGMALDPVDWIISGSVMMVGWRGLGALWSAASVWNHPDGSPSSGQATVVSWMGVSLILTALFMVPLGDYPLTLAAIPLTMGMAGVMAAGPLAWINRVVLSHPVLVAIGKRSYLLYLLHYPLYSLEVLRINQLVTDEGALLLMTALTFGGAWILHALIEEPARRSRITGLWVAGMVACGMLGWILWSNGPSFWDPA